MTNIRSNDIIKAKIKTQKEETEKLENIPEEFKKKEITTSREEFAEITSRLINDIVEKVGEDDEDRMYTRLLLSAFSAAVMIELFDDSLEVEPNGK